MATATITFLDNNDGTVTVACTNSGYNSVTKKTHSLTSAVDWAKGIVAQVLAPTNLLN